MGGFRRGVVMGFATGYVMGSKAGRQRYEQIARGWEKVKASPAFRQASGKAGAMLGYSVERGRLVAMEQATRLRRKVAMRRASGDGM